MRSLMCYVGFMVSCLCPFAKVFGYTEWRCMGIQPMQTCLHVDFKKEKKKKKGRQKLQWSHNYASCFSLMTHHAERSSSPVLVVPSMANHGLESLKIFFFSFPQLITVTGNFTCKMHSSKGVVMCGCSHWLEWKTCRLPLHLAGHPW